MQLAIDPSLAISWLLFLSLFPMAFIWLRRAWRILVRGDHSEVALKGGLSPARPERFALAAGLINLVAGAVASWLLLAVPFYIGSGILLLPSAEYQSWSTIGGVTIWSKLLADFLLGRHAHPIRFGKPKMPPAG
jgi:hypothetical protein